MTERDIDCQIRYSEGMVNDPASFINEIRTIGNRFNTAIVCFDAERLVGKSHAIMALKQARRAIDTKTAISNSFEMESLLYAAGTRQCNSAVLFGLHSGKNCLYVCCCPPSEGVWTDLGHLLNFKEDPGESLSSEKVSRLMTLFGITHEELSAVGQNRLKDLVLERVALLNVGK